jgi:hypothetical protein
MPVFRVLFHSVKDWPIYSLRFVAEFSDLETEEPEAITVFAPVLVERGLLCFQRFCLGLELRSLCRELGELFLGVGHCPILRL